MSLFIISRYRNVYCFQNITSSISRRLWESLTNDLSYQWQFLINEHTTSLAFLSWRDSKYYTILSTVFLNVFGPILKPIFVADFCTLFLGHFDFFSGLYIDWLPFHEIWIPVSSRVGMNLSNSLLSFIWRKLKNGVKAWLQLWFQKV